MDKNANEEVKRLKQEFLEMERVNRDERESLVKVINVLGAVMTTQPEVAVEWETLRQQVQQKGPLPVDLVEEAIKRVKDKILSKEWGVEGLMKEIARLKEHLLESQKMIATMMLFLMEDLYPLTGETAAKASSVKASLTQEQFDGKAAMEGFQGFIKSLQTKIQEDFRYVNSGFLTLLNQVKELEKSLAREFGEDEQIRKVDYFEMKVNEEVGGIINSFNLYNTVAEIKNVVVEKIENIKRMIRAKKEEETEKIRSAQKNIQGLQKRIAEAEKAALEMAKRAEEFHTAAMKDGLTGLYNRKALDLKLATHLRMLSQAGGQYSLALILFDVNDFKSINDGFGHVAGDKVLQKVAQILNETFRKGDFISRYGGDEFAVLIEGMGKDMGLERISVFRNNLSKRRFTSYKAGDIRVSVSAGIAIATEHDTPETVLERADKAMYEEKSRK